MADLFKTWLIPGLCIVENNKVNCIYSVENGNVVRLEKGKVYHFELPAHSEETTYSISPCYYDLATSNEKPAAIDKSLKVNVTTPSVSILAIQPVDCKREAFSYIDQNKGYRYKWTFSFYTTLRVKGFDNIDSFGVKEMSGTTHQYSPRTDSNRRDGTYQLNWHAVHRSNNSTDAGILVVLQSYYVVKGETIDEGKWMSLSMSSDHTYTFYDGSLSKEGEYARRLSSWPNNNGETELQLLSVVPIQ